METESNHLQRVLASLQRNEKRSPLFRWLAEHHDEILEAVSGERIDWATAAESFKQAGLTDATGKPATAKIARATWYKVRRWVATQRAHEQSPRPVKLLPSKMPKDSGPPIASGPTPPRPAERPWATAYGTGSWPKPETEAPSPPTTNGRGAEMLARVKQTLARSGNDKPKGS
jgi:hypothetical protein